MLNRYSLSRHEKIQILGKHFKKSRFLKKENIALLCEETGFSESFIINWFTQRRKILRRESRSSIDSTSSDNTEEFLPLLSTSVFNAPPSNFMETESTFGGEAPLLVSCSPDTSINAPGAPQQHQGLLMIAQPQNHMSTAFMSPPTSVDSDNSASSSPKPEVPSEPLPFDALDNKNYSFTTQEPTSPSGSLSDKETIKTLINMVCAYNLQVQFLLDNQAMMNNRLQAYANALADLQRQQPHSGTLQNNSDSQ